MEFTREFRRRGTVTERAKPMAEPGVAPIGEQLETIGGVLVRFPCKPYPTQKAMMAKVGLSRQ